MLILGIDLETTSLDVATALVIEYGLVVWDTDAHAPIAMTSSLVQLPAGFNLDPEIIRITTITSDMLRKYGKAPSTAAHEITAWCETVEAIAAHNGRRFDKPLVTRWADELGCAIPDKIWIDTCEDIEISPKQSNKLNYMAADYGFVNPFPHRALTDVLTMLRIIDKQNFDQLLQSALTPSITVRADVALADRDLAKGRGYRWMPESKQWVKNMKADKIERERAEASFPVTVMPTK